MDFLCFKLACIHGDIPLITTRLKYLSAREYTFDYVGFYLVTINQLMGDLLGKKYLIDQEEFVLFLDALFSACNEEWEHFVDGAEAKDRDKYYQSMQLLKECKENLMPAEAACPQKYSNLPVYTVQLRSITAGVKIDCVDSKNRDKDSPDQLSGLLKIYRDIMANTRKGTKQTISKLKTYLQGFCDYRVQPTELRELSHKADGLTLNIEPEVIGLMANEPQMLKARWQGWEQEASELERSYNDFLENHPEDVHLLSHRSLGNLSVKQVHWVENLMKSHQSILLALWYYYLLRYHRSTAVYFSAAKNLSVFVASGNRSVIQNFQDAFYSQLDIVTRQIRCDFFLAVTCNKLGMKKEAGLALTNDEGHTSYFLLGLIDILTVWLNNPLIAIANESDKEREEIEKKRRSNELLGVLRQHIYKSPLTGYLPLLTNDVDHIDR